MKARNVLAIGCASLLAPSVALASAIYSDFSGGLDGWSAWQNGYAYPPATLEISAKDGQLHYEDTISYGPYVFADAPAKFRGDWVAKGIGSVGFTHQIINPGTGASYVPYRMEIHSSAGTATWTAPAPNGAVSNTFKVDLTPANWGKSASAMQNILKDVDQFVIQLELVYNNNGGFKGDIAGLDDVRLFPGPRPPKVFGLSIGVSDGTINGQSDAARVFSALQNRVGWASSTDGNTTGPLYWSQGQGAGAIGLISSSLSAMDAVPGDTVVFYYSGHGGFYSSSTGPSIRLDDGSAQSLLGDGSFFPNTGDEYLSLGTDSLETTRLYDDDLAALFSNPKWNGVNKIILLDACYSGGFIGKAGGDGDLSNLDHLALYTSTTENGLAGSDALGQGNWTNLLLPLLEGEHTYSEIGETLDYTSQSLRNGLGDDLVFLKLINGGQVPASNLSDPLFYFSPDLNSEAQAMVPEASTAAFGTLLIACGWVRRRRRQTV